MEEWPMPSGQTSSPWPTTSDSAVSEDNTCKTLSTNHNNPLLIPLQLHAMQTSSQERYPKSRRPSWRPRSVKPPNSPTTSPAKNTAPFLISHSLILYSANNVGRRRKDASLNPIAAVKNVSINNSNAVCLHQRATSKSRL